MNEIFFRLSTSAIQNLSITNKTLNLDVLELTNLNENRSIKRFITNLINKLDSEKFCYERHLLSNKLQEIKSENFPTLKLLKKDILKVKVELINIMKKFDKQTLKDLENLIKPPHFLWKIFLQ